MRAVEKLASSIEEALQLIEKRSDARVPIVTGDFTPASLLDQCLDLCAQQEEARQEPIRTIHHLACTGGTLICKCLAAMPNTQLLSEVDPLSSLSNRSNRPRFAPTDMTTLMLQSTRGARPELIVELFLNSLAIIYSDSIHSGQRMIVRDHAHSHFCVGSSVAERPSLRTLIASRFPVLSVVTVRHPLDSFLSLKSTGWLHFSPPSFDEYCRRCMAFLHAYQGIPVVRYEDFVDAPPEVMNNICNLLEIPFSEQFTDLYGVFRLTGDSGRTGSTIEPRPRREIARDLADDVARSMNYRTLLAMLNYNDDLGELA